MLTRGPETPGSLRPAPTRTPASNLVASATLVAMLCAAGAAARAQPAPGPPEGVPEPALISTGFFPVAEITSRAQATASRLRELEYELGDASLEEQIGEELAGFAGEVEPGVGPIVAGLASAPSLADLEQWHRRWTKLATQLSAREQRLGQRAALLDGEARLLKDSLAMWNRTRDVARDEAAPPGILEDVALTVVSVEAVRQAFEDQRNEVLILQSQVSHLLQTVEGTLAQMAITRDRVLQNILVRDQSPLWRGAFPTAGEAGVADEIGDWLAATRRDISAYAAQSPDRMWLHAGAALLLVWLVRRSRLALDRRNAVETAAGADPTGVGAEEAGDFVGAAARRAFGSPIAGGLVLALLATSGIHGGAPVVLQDLAEMLVVIPVILVLRPLLGESLRPPLYALAGFFLADQLREILSTAGALSRLLFLLEMAVAAAGLAWMLRSSRLERLPRELVATGWLKVAGWWLRGAFLVTAFCAVAGAAGYMSVATLLGDAVLGSAYAALLLYAVLRISEGVVSALMRSRRLQQLHMVRGHHRSLEASTRRLLRLAAVGVWGYVVLGMLAIRAPLGASLADLADAPIGYGAVTFTLGGMVAFGLTLLFAWWFSRTVNFVLDEEVYPRVSLPRGVPFALSTLGRYAILLIGFIVSVGALGFDLDRVTILLGAFGVGIGFGLQNVVNNFVSGLILLFERPIQVGDRVELPDLSGQVTRIGIRATTVRTWDGADVLVPNAMLISDRVVNWTLADRLRRITIPVGVAYGTDPRAVIELLDRVARQDPRICTDPEPTVLFVGFGESTLDFEIRIWADQNQDWVAVRSDVAIGTHDALRDAAIEVPFPQRDLHLRSVAATAKPSDESA